MEKTKVLVCDMCKATISKKKCDFCSCDLCGDCEVIRYVKIDEDEDSDFDDDDNVIMSYRLCKSCSKKLGWRKKALLDSEDTLIKAKLGEKISKRCLAEALTKHKKGEDE